ncbi:uncharacterized protein LOC107038685 [Diachasma alloeum]|uniref:uncharacterized protein LOC107038685 n=1 Tax=Diachasma alloeum TaxID=454923 RepID=UPI000738184C|nr:uncharacterized protein LOC107038685 [Diachasma alloeum]
MLTRAVRPVAQVVRSGVRRYHADDKPFKYPTMDDCPVPQGSWQEYYDKKQKILNVQLVAGITFLVTAFTIAKTNDALYLNSGPKLPEGYVHVKYYD